MDDRKTRQFYQLWQLDRVYVIKISNDNEKHFDLNQCHSIMIIPSEAWPQCGCQLPYYRALLANSRQERPYAYRRDLTQAKH